MAQPERMTEAKWLKIIRDINELIEDPPFGCEADELEEPERPIKWAVSMVQEVHEKLKEICDENEFERPEKWSQKMIDDIRDAIEEGWCNCGCCGFSLFIGYGNPESLNGSLEVNCNDGETTTFEGGETGGLIGIVQFSTGGETVMLLVLEGEGLESQLPEGSLSEEDRTCLESTLEGAGVDVDIPAGV